MCDRRGPNLHWCQRAKGTVSGVPATIKGNEVRTLVLLMLLSLTGCAGTWANSPYAKGCADEIGVNLDRWFSEVGTVQAELINMCIKKKEAVAKI